jgi:hypothetical protein
MSWNSTSTWWGVVRAAVDEADRRCDGVVPWRPEYAPVMTSVDQLRQALGYYWQLNVTAQGDDEKSMQAFMTEHRGLHLVVLGVEAKPVQPAEQAKLAGPTFAHAVAAWTRF